MELNADGTATDRQAELRIHWIEEDAFLASDSITLPDYVLAGTPSVGIKVHQWDQYGNPYRSHSRQQTVIRVNGTDPDGTALTDIGTATGNQDNLTERRQVISRGYASWTPRVRVSAEHEIDVAYDIRQLARNSSGAAVRVGTDTEPNEIADFAAWVALGTSSAQSRKTAVDALRTTYNDARRLIAGTSATVGTVGNNLHPDEINDDADADTLELTDYAAPRGSVSGTVTGSRDPFVYGAPRNAPSGANAEWSDELNTDALDTYQDYEGVTKTAQGLVATPVPVALGTDAQDGSGSVLVVTRAHSADTGQRYNVQLVGKTAEASEFLADSQDDDDRPELVFKFDYDPNDPSTSDIFLDNTKAEGRVITIAAFRTMLKDSKFGSGNEVEVLTYNVDGVSTFSVKSNTP